jgi:hypothetical protein
MKTFQTVIAYFVNESAKTDSHFYDVTSGICIINLPLLVKNGAR